MREYVIFFTLHNLFLRLNIPFVFHFQISKLIRGHFRRASYISAGYRTLWLDLLQSKCNCIGLVSTLSSKSNIFLCFLIINCLNKTQVKALHCESNWESSEVRYLNMLHRIYVLITYIWPSQHSTASCVKYYQLTLALLIQKDTSIKIYKTHVT